MAKKQTEKKAPAKKKAAPKKEAVVLDLKKKYKFECTKDSGLMKKGSTYTVSGEIAQILTDKGLGSVKA